MTLAANNQPVLLMRECQRKCLSHILRNALESLTATLHLIETRKDLTAPMLLPCITNPALTLERIKTSLEEGSFCALKPDECAWIKQYCGCDPPAPEEPLLKNSELSK